MNCTPKTFEPRITNECEKCQEAGYTLENKIFILSPRKGYGIKNKSWEECVDACEKDVKCTGFAYQTVEKTCFLQDTQEGEPVYKENFLYSRPCGKAGFGCEHKECKSCQETGYTTELSYIAGTGKENISIFSEF